MPPAFRDSAWDCLLDVPCFQRQRLPACPCMHRTSSHCTPTHPTSPWPSPAQVGKNRGSSLALRTERNAEMYLVRRALPPLPPLSPLLVLSTSSKVHSCNCPQHTGDIHRGVQAGICVLLAATLQMFYSNSASMASRSQGNGHWHACICACLLMPQHM